MDVARYALLSFSLLGAGCTLIFGASDDGGGGSDSIDAGSGEDEPCLGVQRIYQRGEPLQSGASPTRYDHVDYGRGTMTFWVRALDTIPDSEVLLVDLAGIKLFTDGSGEFYLEMPALSARVRFDVTHNWEPGEDVFVALRWDHMKDVPGAPGVPARVMLRVGSGTDNRYPAQGETFEPIGGESEEILVGDADGHFYVDQLTVYNRPLYVEASSDDDADDSLRALAEEKRSSPTLYEGGLDVVFATASPQSASCGDADVLAWGMPEENEAPGNLGLGDVSGWAPGDFNPDAAAIPDRIFDRALEIGPEQSATADLLLREGQSYVFHALAHAQDNRGSGEDATPYIAIYALNGQDQSDVPLARVDVYQSTTGYPETLFGTFTLPSGLSAARVEIGGHSSQTGKVYFHNVVVRRNYIENPGFEESSCDEIPCPAGSDGWDHTAVGETPSAQVEYSGNTGFLSVCFSGVGQRNVVSPTFSDSLTFVNGEYYAMGSAAWWENTEEAPAPGVNGGNSSFFATGEPHESGSRLSALAISRDRWEIVGGATTRLLGQEFSANQDFAFFGPDVSQPNDVSDACIDDTYLFPLRKIQGER